MKITVFETAKEGKRKFLESKLSFNETNRDMVPENVIRLNPNRTYQEFLGFGGAFTEASSLVFSKLNPEYQGKILSSYFDKGIGHNYSFCRVSIHSCDFSTGNYTYVEDGDKDLKTFTIDHDRETILPFLKKALQKNPKMKILASPWSPPAWMKTHGEMCNGGKLKEEYASVWAKYFIEFINAYREEGIPVFGVTVQNEPEGVQVWESCIFTPGEERDFIKNHLGPELVKAGLGDIKIVIHDHNRNRLFERSRVILEDSEAASYVWGAGFHWYEGDNFQNLDAMHDLYPDKHLVFTEGCQECGTWHGSWDIGERYGLSIINDLNRWTTAWIDWNLLLDTSGGPNHVFNLCSAPILAAPEENKLFYESSYFYLGHFSRFIEVGAKRIFSVSSCDDLLVTAFLNLDDSIVCVVMNQNDYSVEFKLALDDREADDEVQSHSIKTYLISDTSK